MKVVFRVDASQHIGSGHVIRCLVLAEALRLDGHTVLFATREQSSDLTAFIKEKGFKLIHLMQPITWQNPQNTADYEAWLQVSEEQDYQDFVSKVVNVDLVIVDHYGINALWHKKVKQTLKCKLMVIDDLVRLHNADIVLDQTLNRCQKEYTNLHSCLALTGTDYALLKPDFAYVRESLLKKQSPQKHTILISMGGIDQPNASLSVLNALKNEAQKLPTTVLLSKRSPNYEQVKSFALANSGWVEHIEFVEDMPALMSKHTIMIGAPGSTSWERACLGIPSIIVPIADNQQNICKNLEAVGAAISVELNAINKNLMNAYKQLIKNYSEMRSINLNLCDGRGVERIMKQINKLFNNTLNLRFATSRDIDQVYDWQCEPETRRYALNKNVPSLAEHTAWMTRKLESKNDYFYIIELVASKNKKATSVGVVRLDQSDKETYTISIFIAPEHFGKGIAKYALMQVDILHPKEFIKAVVLKENIASQTLFSRAGYTRVNEEQFTRQPVE